MNCFDDDFEHAENVSYVDSRFERRGSNGDWFILLK